MLMTDHYIVSITGKAHIKIKFPHSMFKRSFLQYYELLNKHKVIINACQIFNSSHCRGLVWKETYTVSLGKFFWTENLPTEKFTSIMAYLPNMS